MTCRATALHVPPARTSAASILRPHGISPPRTTIRSSSAAASPRGRRRATLRRRPRRRTAAPPSPAALRRLSLWLLLLPPHLIVPVRSLEALPVQFGPAGLVDFPRRRRPAGAGHAGTLLLLLTALAARVRQPNLVAVWEGHAGALF